MKYRLPIFTLLGLAALTVAAAEWMIAPGCLSRALAQPPSADGEGPDDQSLDYGDPASDASAAEDILTTAARRLHESPPFEAKLRERIDLFGQQLVGSGIYMQAGQGSDQFRLELKIQLADRMTSLTQVCDGRYVWTRRDLGPEQQYLSHIDLVRVRRALAESGSAAIPPNQWLAIGGLPGLLNGLSENFAFNTPATHQLGQLPVWTTKGSWRPEMLAELLPNKADAILAGKPAPLESLPVHLPASVAVALGRDDYLPLFPYRIEFRRLVQQPKSPELNPTTSAATSATPAAARSVEQPMLILELFEVRSPAVIDPRAFTYDAGDQEDHDETETLIRRLLGLGSSP